MNSKAKTTRPGAPIVSLGLDKFGWQRAVIGENDLGPTTRHVLLTLSIWMNKEPDQHGSWSCHPSMETLAKASGLGERTVRAHIAIARAAGWIEVVSRGGTKGWRRFEYFPVLPDGAASGAARSADTKPMVRHVVPDGAAAGADGAAADDSMVRQHVPITSHSTNQFYQSNTKGADAPKAVDKNGKRNQRGLQGIGGLLPPIGEKPVCQEASTPLESDFPYFESGSVLDLAAKTIGRIPSYNLRKATLELRRQIDERGQEAVEARCRTAPTDPIKCWAHVRQRDS